MASQLCLDSKQIDQIVYNTYTFLLKQKQENAENTSSSSPTSPTSNTTTVPADATNSSTTELNSNSSSSIGQNTINNKTVKLTPLERAISSNAIPPPRVSYRDINIYLLVSNYLFDYHNCSILSLSIPCRYYLSLLLLLVLLPLL